MHPTTTRQPTFSLDDGKPVEIIHSPDALRSFVRDESGIGADDERDERQRKMDNETEGPEAMAYRMRAERQPLLTLSIAGVVDHLGIADEWTHTITEKTTLQEPVTPHDYQALFGAMACALRVANALLDAVKAANVIGAEKQILAEQEAADARVLRDGGAA